MQNPFIVDENKVFRERKVFIMQAYLRLITPSFRHEIQNLFHLAQPGKIKFILTQTIRKQNKDVLCGQMSRRALQAASSGLQWAVPTGCLLLSLEKLNRGKVSSSCLHCTQSWEKCRGTGAPACLSHHAPHVLLRATSHSSIVCKAPALHLVQVLGYRCHSVAEALKGAQKISHWCKDWRLQTEMGI